MKSYLTAYLKLWTVLFENCYAVFVSNPELAGNINNTVCIVCNPALAGNINYHGIIPKTNVKNKWYKITIGKPRSEKVDLSYGSSHIIQMPMRYPTGFV